MMDWLWDLVQALGGVAVIVVTAAGAAYGFFRLFAERWLNSKFDERLEALKHSHQQELETLRGRISALMDRTMKLHEREYDALPSLWEKLAAAQAEVGGFISSIQSVADISRMTPDQLEEFLTTSDLLETQKQTLRNTPAAERTMVFRKELYWHRKAAVRAVLRDFSRYLKFNGIFVLPAIKSKASSIERLLWDAMLEYEVNEENDLNPRLRDAGQALDSEGKALSDEIESLVQDRLWTVTGIS